jgi:mannose-1-phosphate guanylyltransferase
VPFLEHQLSRLAVAGVRHVVVATSYRAELFAPVLGDGSRWGIRVDYVQEAEPLGTAGAIRNVASALASDPEGAVVVLNGDVLSGHDLAAQLRDFETPRDGRPVDVSLHLVEVDDARAFGCVPTDDTGRVTGFTEKSDQPVTNQVNAGCYVFRRRVVDLIPEHRVVSVERETFPGLVRDGALVVGHVENAYWRDVGTPAALVAASRDLVLGTAPSPAVPRGQVPPSGDAAARIDGAAQVDPTARVDGGSVVVRDARVGPAAEVTGSVLMAGCTVEADATVLDSVVGPGAYVGRGVRLDGVTVGDGAVLEPGTVLTPGQRVDCGARLPEPEVSGVSALA